MCSSPNPNRKGYIACSALYRGKLSTLECEEQLKNYTNENSSNFVEWIPDKIKCSICDIPPNGLKMAVTFIANSQSILEIFSKILNQFKKLYKRKAYVHWYTGEGIDSDLFRESESNVEDLIQEYQNKQESYGIWNEENEQFEDD